jgi:hypothetical protein
MKGEGEIKVPVTATGLAKAVFFAGFKIYFILVTKSLNKKCNTSGYLQANESTNGIRLSLDRHSQDNSKEE